MASYLLITDSQLGAFAAAAHEMGFKASNFEIQEDVFDPQTAEAEARTRPDRLGAGHSVGRRR